MYINTQKRVVFISVPKTACTSIRKKIGMKPPDPRPPIYHASIQYVIEQHPETKDYFKIGFVRNPWDRLVSAYVDLSTCKGHAKWAYPIYEFKDFNDFCLNFQNSPCRDFIHLQPQFSFLNIDNKVCMDFVGRFENLEEDVIKVEDILGLNHDKLEHYRKTKRTHYKDYYTNKTQEAVKKIYGIDIETFGYSFND